MNFVFFVDHDDEVVPEYFNLMTQELLSGADVVVSSMCLSTGGVFCARPLDRNGILSHNSFGAGIGVHKTAKSIREVIGVFGGLYEAQVRSHFEDWELNVLLAEIAVSLVIVPLPIYIYHISSLGRNASNPHLRRRAEYRATASGIWRGYQVRAGKRTNNCANRFLSLARKIALLEIDTVKSALSARPIRLLTCFQRMVRVLDRVLCADADSYWQARNALKTAIRLGR